MKGRCWVVCSFVGMMGCELHHSEQRSVNPELAIREAGVDAALDGGETTVQTTKDVPPAVSVSSGGSHTSQPVEAGAVRVVDAGPPPNVYWGLQPGSPGLDAGLAGDALARLEVMAFGSRIMTYVSTGEHDDFAAISSAPDMGWVVTLPSERIVAMDDAALAAWVERVWLLGDAVRFLILGQHLENDLVPLPSAERGLLVRRLEEQLIFAKAHVAKPPNSSVGVGLVTLVDVPTSLLWVSDVVALSYSGIKPTGEVQSPEEAYGELRGRMERVADYRLPVILQDLAYPSLHAEKDQRAFFARVNAWFSGPTPPDVRAVVVSSLNPPTAADCELWAAEWQVPTGADARCSVGMRNVDGEPKPALSEVVSLLAEFAQL